MSEGALTKWFGEMTGKVEDGARSTGLAKKHVDAAGHAIRQYAESGLTGAVLGAISAEGVTGLDVKGVPVDGVAAAAGFLGSMALANHEDGLGHDARNVGAAAFTVLTFRKTEALMHEKKQAALHGDDPNYAHDGDRVSLGRDHDPILAAAAALRQG